MVLASTVKLNSGNSIPVLGLGVYQTPTDVADSVVQKALDIGYRHFDSAAAYKNEQEVADAIGAWLKKNPNVKRKDIFYTTKVFDTEHGYEATKKLIATSLEKAKAIDYIDLFLVHSPQSNYEKRHGTWLALQEAVESGKVKNIGVSNYGIKHIKELLAYPDLNIKPAVNQIELHPWLGRADLVKYLKDEGIAVEAYSPLARGPRSKRVDDPALGEFAKKYGKTNGQILIAWSLAKGFIPLPKTVTESRLISNFESLNFKLSDEDIKKLDAFDVYGVTGWDPTVYPLDNEKEENK
ncbi:unnamed protein product [Ambrosiozyma monospora]|uniref:Unnamed protein product n=1 Tax=Ambrosiozyma monospora TaxID=43982 RepID=A0ACB5STZ9_AMBMO|nr:unnamed protein product [Ambrosiozyma monospora]